MASQTHQTEPARSAPSAPAEEDAASGPRVASLDDGSVAARTLLGHPGPAVWVSSDGTIVAGNESAALFAPLLAADDGAGLRVAMRQALISKRPLNRVVTLTGESGPEQADVWLLPSADGHHVALLGREAGFDATLYRALSESRARFKDLVALSSDFAWEADAEGRLIYVSPDGALGHMPPVLLGADPVALLDAAEPEVAMAAFRPQHVVRDAEVWVRDAQGRAACLLVSSLPLTAPDGTWTGARGLARDVTAWRERERGAARAQDRERLRTHMARAFRDEPDVAAILERAAHDLSRGLEATGCLILRARAGTARADLLARPASPRVRDLLEGGRCGRDDMAAVVAALPDEIPDAARPLLRIVGKHFVLCVGTTYRGHANGCVVMTRPADGAPWDTDDVALVQDVAIRIAVANEQIMRFETMLDMSRTDPLTGMLNRRAFLQDLERRLTRLQRGAGTGALLFIDLDNFKPVNDRRGHAVGDQVLITLADIVRGQTRPTDLVARLGGDEFAVWLEGADATVAGAKARDFLVATAGLNALSADADAPLGMSIGIAVRGSDQPEDVEALTRRADGAMYLAKRHGKGTFHVAAPASMPSPSPSSSGGPPP